jgi:DNA-binding response OmpR family regulator
MPKKIILVEDTADLRNNMAELLTMEKYEVLEAANGAEAMALLKRIIPDLIITDLLMPTMDGFDFIKAVRQNPNYKNVPILVFSATPAHTSEKKVLELGANAYLKKPSTLENLVSSVNKLIKK